MADRQRVEILKVLYRGARIIILDEPTAVLVPQEVDELFDTLRTMRADGYTFLFISHKLDEVRAIADSITVIRRGTTVGTVDPKIGHVPPARRDDGRLGAAQPGDPRRPRSPTRRSCGSRASTLETTDGRRLLDPLDLVVRSGEVLGIAGVEGNGQTELVEAIMGIRKAAGGRILLDGQNVTRSGTLARREAGIGYIPEDRTRHGLLLTEPLWKNRILGYQTRRPTARGMFLDIAGARKDTQRIVEQFDVRTPGIEVAAASLSGGNQQKLVVGRELSGEPKLLIASHPTRGVDVGAQAAIWDHIRNARRRRASPSCWCPRTSTS